MLLVWLLLLLCPCQNGLCAWSHEAGATYSLFIDEKTEAWRHEHSAPESGGARINQEV